MPFNAILSLQIHYLLQNLRLFRFFRRLPSHQQHILRRVLHLDELHYLCFVSEILQDQGANGVGNHHSLAFKEDAVARDGVDLARALHLLPDLFVAAGGADNQLRTRLMPEAMASSVAVLQA